jgi:hypothetical protein
MTTFYTPVSVWSGADVQDYIRLILNEGKVDPDVLNVIDAATERS